MDDRDIVKLFFERSEDAIAQSKLKYGRYCRYIAGRILPTVQDVEEAESDAYMKAWQRIPPDCPEDLGAYLGMISRQTAVDKYKSMSREKRGRGQYALTLDELAECIPDRSGADALDVFALRDVLNSFLASLPEKQRRMFMQRYFWASGVSEIAAGLGMKESAVKMALMRMRGKLKDRLEKEGFYV